MLHASNCKLICGAYLTLAMLVSCERQTARFAVRDAVLSAGEIIEASNRYGKITISYVDTLRRRYAWDGNERIVTLIPRQQPFRGKLGLYEPADSWGMNPFEIRLVVEEAVRHFDTEDEMKEALIEGSAVMDWVYTNDGLVVGFGQVPSRKQVNIDVFQFLLRGKKPSELQGARPENIVVRRTGD